MLRATRSMLRLTVLLLSVLLTGGLLGSVFPARAATGLAFLKTGVDARAAILGQAMSAHVAGPSACHWNPAGLAETQRPQLLVSHIESFADLRHEYAAVTQPLGGMTAGFAFNGSWSDNLEGYNEIGEPTGEFGYSAYEALLSLGTTGPFGTRLGVGAKYISESIGSYEATGYAADLGVQWAPAVATPLRLGLSVRNLGPAMSFIEEEFDLPLTVQGGVAWQRPLAGLQGELTLAADVRHVRDQGTGLLAGVEYGYRELLSFGVGYQGGEDTRDLSLGLGAQRGRFAIHWAYVPISEDLGDEHRFSLAVDL